MDLIHRFMNLNEEEEILLDKWYALPEEVLPFLLKMLDDHGDSFEEGQQELLAYLEKHPHLKKK